MADHDIDKATGVETTGHEWDGIKELNNPLPRWWLWCLYLTIIWGIGYLIAYPAWPMIDRATTGVLGYSTRGEVAVEIAKFEDQNAALRASLAQADLTTLTDNADLHRFAVAGGAAVFRTNCSQCHGAGAAGAKGYPNLLDDDWLWGGNIEEIAYSIRHGIRNDTDGDAHWSQMPAFGEILSSDEIDQVVAYVSSLSGLDADTQLISDGSVIFAENCSSCHGETATGDRDFGAPNLTDALWLYGGDPATMRETIANSRFGVMPAWGQRLSTDEVNAVAAYVHQLGGGE